MKKMDLNRLKAERVARGYTQETLSEALGWTKQNYFRKESGKVDLTVNELLEIMNVLNIQISDMFIFVKNK